MMAAAMSCKLDRGMRLLYVDPQGQALDVKVGDLLEAIKAEMMPQIMAEIERRVLADLRAMLAGAAPPTPPAG